MEAVFRSGAGSRRHRCSLERCSPDAHPISGTFSFTSISGAEAPAASAEQQDASATAQEPSVEDQPEPTTEAPAVESLDSFLASETQGPGWADRLGSIGRILTMVGVLFGVGALVFAVTSLRGSRREVGGVVYWVRRSGLLVVLGAVAELVGALGVEAAGDMWNMWSPTVLSAVLLGSTGIAIGLRVLGGVGLVMGPKMAVAPAEHVADPVLSLRGLTRVAAGSGSTSNLDSLEVQVTDEPEPSVHRTGEWALPPAGCIGAFLGGAVLLMSFAFDGHTVANGNRLLMAVADVLHVGAGAVWLGGVVTLTCLLWGRHRRGRDLEALPLVIRFSVVASVALVVVGVAGVAMAVMILDAPSQLWATPWGRLLLWKTLFVVLAAAGGAYNHRVLVPQLESRADEGTSQMLRAVVTGESVALIVVAILTAFLVAAST